MRETTQETQSLHPVIIRLLQKRNLSLDGIREFFSWNLNGLPLLTDMKDMDKAAERILEAMNKGQKIGIYGDYDVDGTTSCALFHHFFLMNGVHVELFQPSRFVEGYGVHPSSIEAAIDKEVQLLITVDCGITNVETAEYALEKGLDLIITDHHKDAAEKMPPAYAVVNPNRRDEPKESELKFLAGVGVAFAVCLRVKQMLEEDGAQTPSLYPLLQFVSVGTICDMAKLTPMNLKLCRHGLKQMVKSQYPGLLSFIPPEEREFPQLPSDKVSFVIGPHINSKGRLEHPEKALNLLISKDSQEAYENFSHLEISNRERKFIQAEVFAQAKAQFIENMTEEEQVICISYSPEWHEGVIGIVASKMVESFDIPAIVFTDSEKEGIIKASARSAGDLNIFDELKKCEDLFLKFGGHKSAAGLSMPKENFAEFKKRMNEQLKEIPVIGRTTQDHFDIEIDFNEINHDLLRDMEKLEPFGQGNKRPVFRMKGIQIDAYRVLKDQHVRWDITSKSGGRKLQGISFFYIGKWGQPSPEEIFQRQTEEEITLQFTLGINRFNGREYIQLMIEKVLFN
jgi:single-stranded-DNA-specific exonuclease